MLVKLKNTKGEPHYKVYADHAKKKLVLRTKCLEEAEARELLIVADIVTAWAADLETRGPYANFERKKYADHKLRAYLLFTYGRGLAMLNTALLCEELNYSIHTINTQLMTLRRRGAISTKKIFQRKYIYIH